MTKRGVKLIAPDKNGILCYQGDCKVIIDPIYKVLQIHPKNFEEFYNISVLFEKKFIQKKNLLFIFGEYNFQDFVLVFKNEEICKKVHDIIYKHKEEEEEDYIKEEEFQQRLLIPIFQKLPQNYSTRFKRVMIDWIEQHEEEEKMELLNLLKRQRRNIQMMDIKNVKQEPNVRNVRKRRFSEIENSALNEEENNESIMVDLNIVKCENEIDIVPSKKKKEECPDIKIIDESLFKIVSVKKENGFHRKLLIFTSNAKTQCYEYNYYSKKQFFYHKCHKNGMKAILAFNKNGNECIKYEKKKHRCSPIQYDSKTYMEIRIVKKPDYKIFDNCASKFKRRMVIFDPNNRHQCYEYYWEPARNKFLCCGCSIQNKYIFAEIVHENTDAEYILILNNQHFCKMRNYDPIKYPDSNNFVLSPNFEIQKKIKDGIERKTLVIFYGNDRKLCYMYFFDTSKKLFYCNGCHLKQKQVSAKIFQNNDGEEYVILSNFKHICSPKEYVPQPKEIIIRPPKINFLESTETFKSKLFIFASNDNKMCYIFSKCPAENTKRYYCFGCHKLTKRMNYTVFLYQASNDSNGEYYVKMVDGQKHVCKPQKYDPEKYQRKILKPSKDYVLFQRKEKTKNSVGLVIYDSNDNSFCFNFYYCKSKKCFQCYGCHNKNSCLTAKIHQDSDGNEYIIMNQMKHVCTPIKVSSIIKPNTVVLEKSGLSVEPAKKKEIDESRIVRLPYFELQKNIKGVPDRKLIVFYGDDKELCYEYGYNDKFVCKKCKVSATLHYDPKKNNEKYIILGIKKHTCEPVNYVAEKTKIIKSSQFMIFNQNDDSKLTKLVIFTSTTKEECYEYTFINREKSFRCCGCYALKKNVSSKLLKNSKNEEYIQLSKIDHICTPKKFIMEEFQPKIIPESGFKLCCNQYGKENSKLILFDSEKDGFNFEYCLKRNNIFICIQCQYKKKWVTAKLCEKENGEKFLELSAETHICKSRKCKEKKKKLLLLQCNENGEKEICAFEF